MSTPHDVGATERRSGSEQVGRHWSAAAAPPEGRRWGLIIAALLLAVVVGIGGLSVFRLQQNLMTSPLNLGQDGWDDSGATDILIMGSDTRAGEQNSRYGDIEEGNGTGKTDVMMLAHISEDREDVTVVSFPRDLIVDIPECTDPETGEVHEAEEGAMLNSAAENGGPGCTVATIGELTGLNIDHFMLADFNAVTELSRAVGGVEVCVTHEVDDPKSGLELPAGTSSIEGEQALAFLRSRAAFGDGGDESRIRSQQQFMASLARKLQAEGTLTNIPRLYEIADVMTQNLHVDEQLGNVTRIVGLANELAGVDLSRVVFVSVPTEVYPEDPNRLQLQEQPSEDLFEVLREDGSLTEDGVPEDAASESGSGGPSAEPSAEQDASAPEEEATAQETADDAPAYSPESVPVTILDASGADGRGQELAEQLADAGYELAQEGEVLDEDLPGTQLHYAMGWQGAAEQVAEELGIPGSQIAHSPDLAGGVSLTVGEDFAEGETMEVDSEVPGQFSGQTAEQFTCQQ
ncbi:LCP family protein [Kocuria palustris]|uniref:LCP family protein n=1 Tax=Kocuria palustris TaxID=71999 RepID=UPI0011A87FBE|nr:LCP family protein [Kocuria palustris]